MKKNHSICRNNSLAAVTCEKDIEKRSVLWREWLDSFYLSDDEERRAMLAEEPPFSGDVWDALVAAGTEWLAHRMGCAVPRWAMTPSRRARTPYWGRSKNFTKANGFDHDRAPSEFFSRHLYIGPEIMLRARMPKSWIPQEPKWAQRAVAAYQKRL